MRVALRSITVASGAQSVTTSGTSMMATSSAGSWDIAELRTSGLALTLVREPDRSGWTTFAVLGMRPTSLIAHSQAGVPITVDIMKMLESLVPLVINYKLISDSESGSTRLHAFQKSNTHPRPIPSFSILNSEILIMGIAFYVDLATYPL